MRSIGKWTDSPGDLFLQCALFRSSVGDAGTTRISYACQSHASRVSHLSEWDNSSKGNGEKQTRLHYNGIMFSEVDIFVKIIQARNMLAILSLELRFASEMKVKYKSWCTGTEDIITVNCTSSEALGEFELPDSEPHRRYAQSIFSKKFSRKNMSRSNKWFHASFLCTAVSI